MKVWPPKPASAHIATLTPTPSITEQEEEDHA